MTQSDAQMAGDQWEGSSPEAREAFREHEHTYRGFLGMTKWFVVHLILILIGLYFMFIPHNYWMGGLFWLVALVLMGYGTIASALKTRED